MSTFVLKREYTLQMPTSYVDIDRDEMEYVDGGYLTDFSKNWIAYTIDISLLFFGAAKLAEGLSKLMVKMGRYQLATLITTVSINVSNWLGKNQNYSNVLSKVNGLLGIICSFSAGNAVATVIDYLDFTPGNGRIQF